MWVDLMSWRFMIARLRRRRLLRLARDIDNNAGRVPLSVGCLHFKLGTWRRARGDEAWQPKIQRRERVRRIARCSHSLSRSRARVMRGLDRGSSAAVGGDLSGLVPVRTGSWILKVMGSLLSSGTVVGRGIVGRG